MKTRRFTLQFILQIKRCCWTQVQAFHRRSTPLQSTKLYQGKKYGTQPDMQVLLCYAVMGTEVLQKKKVTSLGMLVQVSHEEKDLRKERLREVWLAACKF